MASTSSLQPDCDFGRDFVSFKVTRRAPPCQDEYWKYITLRGAAADGDWKSAKEFFEKNPDAVTASINEYQENALQVAVQAGKKAIDFVEHLVEKMPIDALEHKNVYGETVLIYAAVAGNRRAAEILVQKHPRLLFIPDKLKFLPVHTAAEYDQKDTFKFLLSVTEEEQDGVKPFAEESGAVLVMEAIFSGYYEEALKLIHRYRELATLRHPNGESVLSAIASKVSAFPSESRMSFWEEVIYSYLPLKLDKYAQEPCKSDMENPLPTHNLAQISVPSFYIPVSQRLRAMLYKVLAFLVPHIKHIGDKKQEHHQATLLMKFVCQQIPTLTDYEDYESIVKGPLLSAAKLGVKEVVEEILHLFPDAAGFTDEKSHYAFELAILYRQEKVFNILYQMDQFKQVASHHYDDHMNNMLHLAARLAPLSKLNCVPNAALQMQRELQWYKEVEKFVPPKYRLQKNSDGKIPAELFTEEHKKLVREGEEWMKDAANSCTIVASLIATIAFAAAITGLGDNDDSELPIFARESAFVIFAISNALSLFASATSLLTFLSILTSRYGESDFLYRLPRRLTTGFVTLFL